MRDICRTLISLGLLLGSAAAFAADPDLDLTQYRGKVVYLDFWASWCAPCRRSFPWMDAMQQKYGNDGLVVIAVNLDEQRADADTFLRQVPVHFGIVFDPEGKLAQQYKLVAMPMSFLIGPDGKVDEIHNGFFDDSPARYEQEIKNLLPH